MRKAARGEIVLPDEVMKDFIKELISYLEDEEHKYVELEQIDI